MNRDVNGFLRVVESILKRILNEKSEEKPEAEQPPQKKKVEPRQMRLFDLTRGEAAGMALNEKSEEKPEAEQPPQKKKVEPRQMRLFDDRLP